jgi:hypothetical protein
MRSQLAVWTGVFVATAWVLPASGVDRAAAQTAFESRSAAERPGPPRTPWGHPDLQGTWTSEPEFGVPFERPAQFGTRQLLTDEEYAQRLAQTEQREAAALESIDVFSVDVSNAGAIGSPTSPPPHWLERSTVSRRTSLVIDPPDGRIPPLTTHARERQRRTVRGSFGEGPFNSPADFTLYDRCITFGGVPGAMFPAVYNANTRIVQGPDVVAITYEMIHETRVIPLDGRRPLSPDAPQFLGNARGRWEGDTLVVHTTNFDSRTSYRGSTEKLTLVERFTRVNENTLRYEVTVEDPETWVRPWTAGLDLAPQPQGMFEYACHEGNYGMFNMLTAARAADKDAKQD